MLAIGSFEKSLSRLLLARRAEILGLMLPATITSENENWCPTASSVLNLNLNP